MNSLLGEKQAIEISQSITLQVSLTIVNTNLLKENHVSAVISSKKLNNLVDFEGLELKFPAQRISMHH